MVDAVDRAEAADDRTVGVEPEIGRGEEELLQRDPQLQPRQMGAEAAVRPASEGKVPVVLAREVDLVGPRELGCVPT